MGEMGDGMGDKIACVHAWMERGKADGNHHPAMEIQSCRTAAVVQACAHARRRRASRDKKRAELSELL